MPSVSSIDQYIEEFNQAQAAAMQALAKKVQPIVNRLCDTWGLHYVCGNNDWYLMFIGTRVRAEDNLLDYLENGLAEKLTESVIGNFCLGTFLENYTPSPYKYRMYYLEGESLLRCDELEGKRQRLKMVKVDGAPPKLEDNDRMGPLPKQIAELIIKLFETDRKAAGQVIAELPFADR